MEKRIEISCPRVVPQKEKVPMIRELRNVIPLSLTVAKEAIEKIMQPGVTCVVKVSCEIFDNINFEEATRESEHGIVYAPLDRKSKAAVNLQKRLHQLITAALREHDHKLVSLLNAAYMERYYK